MSSSSLPRNQKAFSWQFLKRCPSLAAWLGLSIKKGMNLRRQKVGGVVGDALIDARPTKNQKVLWLRSFFVRVQSSGLRRINQPETSNFLEDGTAFSLSSVLSESIALVSNRS